jgi:OFA family oxalate/formate antiporter-like MFS transporter
MIESRIDEQKTTVSRLLVPISALLIGLCLGSGYGWSVFVKPLMAQHGWSQTQVTLTYSLCLFSQGLAYLLTGCLADRHPRTMAVVGGLVFGVAFILAGLFAHYGCLIPLYLFYGVMGGFASGLPYLASLSAAVKWFPRHCGLISGISVMGAGMGAVFVGLFTPHLIMRFGPGITLMGMGTVFLLVCGGLGSAIRNPPQFKQLPAVTCEKRTVLPWDALRQGKFWALWGMLFISMSAGLALITQASPMAQDLRHMSAATAGTLVAMMAICNGVGRLFWSSLSDKIGRPTTFIILFGSQACVFLSLVQISNVWLFGVAFCYITFCYGGGVGTMPAFTADLFGGANLGRVYGPILFAQSIAGLVGPLLYSTLKECTGGYGLSTRLTGVVLILACSLPLIVVRMASRRPEEKSQSALPLEKSATDSNY